MNSPLGLEYDDAVYPAMDRGRNREVIFHDTCDYRVFIELMKKRGQVCS